MRWILSILLLVCTSATADVWRPASSFALSSPWGYVYGGDTPNGGWYSNIGTNSNTLTMSVHLGTNLPAGSYAVAIKSDDYGYDWATHISAGGGTVTNYTSDRDVNGSWSLFSVLTAATSFTNVTVVFSNEVAIAGLKTGVEGLFITERTDAYMLTSSEYVTLTVPSTNSYDNTSQGVNLIPNGSFEAGVRGVGLFSLSRTQSIFEAWDDTVAWDGRASLRLITTNGQAIQVITKPIKCATNRVYVASFRAKSTGTNTGLIRMKSPFTAPSGFTATLDSFRQIAVTTNWTLVSITNRVLAYPFAEINVTAQLTGIGHNTNWIDGLSLYDAQVTNYVAEAVTELAVHTPKLGNLYYSDETVAVPVRIANSSTVTVSGTIYAQAYDYLNRQILSASRTYALTNLQTNSVSFTFQAGLQGSFRMIVWDPVNGGEPAEATISVVPRPKGIDKEFSKFGGHFEGAPWVCRMMTNAGFKHVRRLSPGAYFRFGLAWPSATNKVYFDEGIDVANSFGLVSLGNLTQTQSPWQYRTYCTLTNVSGSWSNTEMVSSATATGYLARAFASTNFTGTAVLLSNVIGAFTNTSALITGRVSGASGSITGLTYPTAIAMDLWANFVTDMATHYSSSVTNWEVGNEYKQEGSYIVGSDGLYSEFLRETILALKAIQPNCRIVALGGIGGSSTNAALTVITNMTEAGLITNIHSISVHTYPSADEEAPLTQWVSTNKGIAWMNSESGATDLGPKSFWGSNARRQGTPIELFNTSDRYYYGNGWISAMVIRNHLTSLGHGAFRIYTYDHRGYAPDYYGREYGNFDYDDAPKVTFTAVVCLAGMIDGKTSLGLCNTNTGVNCFAWDGTTNTVVSVHSRSSTNLWTCTLPGGMFGYVRHDMMGNPVGTNEASFKVSGYPYFLVLTNSAASVATNMALASFALATDTTAPNPVIAEWPSVPAPTNSQRIALRWFAIDELSKPESATASEAITYRVKVSPQDADFRDWSSGTELDAAGFSQGRYTMTVIARDVAGNTNGTTRSFYIGPAPSRSTVTANRLTVGTLRLAN